MKRQLISGIVAVVSQAITVAFVLWLIKNRLGADIVGLWAVLMSILSIMRFSEFGLGQSLVHFSQVARSQELEHGGIEFETYFKTAFTASLVGALLFVAAIYIPLSANSAWFVDQEYSNIVAKVLPIMALSLFIAVAARVPMAALTGLEYFWIGQVATTLGAIGYGIIAWYFITDFGLVGVSYGHLFMSVASLFVAQLGLSILRLKQVSSFQIFFPIGFEWRMLKKMFSLSLSIQFTSVLSFFLEPVSRIALGWSGGLELVGYYEMASRFVTTPREFVGRSFAFLSGRISFLHKSKSTEISSFYKRNMRRLNLMMGVMAFLLLVGVFPAADFWVGERHPFFLLSVLLLSVGWLPSVPALISWYWGIGTGYNRLNLLSVALMVAIAVTSSIISIVLGQPILIPAGVGIGILFGQIVLMTTVRKYVYSQKNE